MLGWYISVFRLDRTESEYSGLDSLGERIAVWQSDWGGIEWLNELVRKGRARILSTNGGYPIRFAALAEDILPIVLSGPPDAYNTWKREDGDIVPLDWEGKTTINHDAVFRCLITEMLVIEAWDES